MTTLQNHDRLVDTASAALAAAVASAGKLSRTALEVRNLEFGEDESAAFAKAVDAKRLAEANLAAALASRQRARESEAQAALRRQREEAAKPIRGDLGAARAKAAASTAGREIEEKRLAEHQAAVEKTRADAAAVEPGSGGWTKAATAHAEAQTTRSVVATRVELARHAERVALEEMTKLEHADRVSGHGAAILQVVADAERFVAAAHTAEIELAESLASLRASLEAALATYNAIPTELRESVEIPQHAHAVAQILGGFWGVKPLDAAVHAVRLEQP